MQLFFRIARGKTKSLIHHKKAYLQTKLIKTNLADFFHGNFSFGAGLGKRSFVCQIYLLNFDNF